MSKLHFITIRPMSSYGFELGSMAEYWIAGWAETATGRRELELEHAEDLVRAKRKRGYEQARGCAPSLTGLSPEEAIRRSR